MKSTRISFVIHMLKTFVLVVGIVIMTQLTLSVFQNPKFIIALIIIKMVTVELVNQDLNCPMMENSVLNGMIKFVMIIKMKNV